MVIAARAKEIALKNKPGFVVTNAVRYKEYYVFFMQPEGVDPLSEDAVLDSYVFVNSKTGKVEYRSPIMFPDFIDEAVDI